MLYRSKLGSYYVCLKCDAYYFHDLWFWRMIHNLAHRT